MHNMNAVFDSRALWNEYWRIPIFASSTRKCSVFICVAHIYGNNGVEAQCFIVYILEVLTVFKFCKGYLGRVGVCAEVFEDNITQLFIACWVAGKREEDWARS